jgi:hypothetical protein
MYYPDKKEYITFVFSLLDKFAETKQAHINRGRPKTYSDVSLVVFYATMTLKQINTTRAQHRWLYTHPLMLETLRLPYCPSRSTLARRYKALLPYLSEFCEFIAEWSVSNGYGFPHALVYEDKSLFKARGRVWHNKDRAKNYIPKGLRNVDKTASWSKSGYHGWVYGYGLHLTTTRHGFPIMFDVLPANVNERKVLDKKHNRIVAKGIKCLIADAGYRDKKRTTALAKKQVMLITPDICFEQAATMFRPRDAMAIAFFNEAKAVQKTAIEPTFDLLSKLLATTGQHKPIPVRGLAAVSTFLGLGVLLLQLTMLVNIKWQLPTRNVTHIKTVFQ